MDNTKSTNAEASSAPPTTADHPLQDVELHASVNEENIRELSLSANAQPTEAKKNWVKFDDEVNEVVGDVATTANRLSSIPPPPADTQSKSSSRSTTPSRTAVGSYETKQQQQQQQQQQPVIAPDVQVSLTRTESERKSCVSESR